MAEHCPLGRCATPEDVARVVAFLASEDAGWVNGQSTRIVYLDMASLTVAQAKSSRSLVVLPSKSLPRVRFSIRRSWIRSSVAVQKLHHVAI